MAEQTGLRKQFCLRGHDKIENKTPSNQRCRTCARTVSSDRWLNRPDYQRDMSLKRLYGISLKEYDLKLKEQDYRCAMCKRHHTEFTKRLAVDHNHLTNAVRDILCSKCNTGLKFIEDTVFLKMSQEYLEKHNG